jgi:hypothetical protein
MESNFGHLCAGFMRYFLLVGVLGGLVTILGIMGLVYGAVLP